ncbi:PilZ domain-containing protein [Pseudoduganella sp. SL102]|uniref:PilZ domain-containing protein n=1 Tax=Pseudoduganella sp. SL102 TaxID=2995154 RepID=UPI00248CE6F5|nr:PilZ domain-containing protein [Pseudoduganella sp. SL102]WBS05044.1 PilZ domain-containing protein [Pseudoduganella sp. SL102]
MLVDQRQGVRKILRVRAMVVIDGAAPVPARTFDLSLGGMSVTSGSKVEPGQTGQVVFEMLVDGKPQIITCRAKVSHCIFSGNEFKVGFVFLPLNADATAAITKFMR